MISSRMYTAASRDSLKRLFSRQNFLQLSAFRKMESEKRRGGSRRGGSLNSRGRRHPSSRYFRSSSQSASYEGQKDEPSIATFDANDNGHSHIGGHQHERKVAEGSQVRYSIWRPRNTPAQDSHNFCKSDEPSIATSDIKDNGPSHIGGRQHEQKVGEGSQDKYPILRPRHTPSAQDAHNSCKSHEQLFQDTTLGDGNQDGNLSYKASYEGQKDKPSIATSDVNDNGRSHIGGREHERRVGEGSQDGHSISRLRHSPSAQDSPNSHKSVPFKSSMHQKDEPSIATSNIKDNGPSHVGGRQHEQKVGEGSQDRHSILRPRHTPSAQDSHNSRKSHERMFQDMTLGDGNQDGNSSYKASYEGQKDKPSIAPSDVNDNGRSHIGAREHERKVGEGSQDGYSISRPRHSPSAQDSPNSHKSASYQSQKDEPSIATSDTNDNGHSHIGGHHHERKVGEGSQDRYSILRPRHTPIQDSHNSRKLASYSSSMYQKDEPSISPSDIKDNGHCHIGGCQHERVVGEESQDSYSSSRLKRSPFAPDSYNSRKSCAGYQQDEPSIAISDIKDNGPSHIGGHQHELMVGEGGRDRHSSSKRRHSPFAQDSPNSLKSNEQMFQDRMLGEGNRDGNLIYRVRHSPSVEASSNPCVSASYEGQKDEPSIATSDANDNGHSNIGGRQHERKVGEGSQDRYSILRPRHAPAQDSHNSRKSVPYESSMYQKDEPSIATSDIKDNGPSHIGGRQHEQKVGEGSQDRYSILRPRHTPSAQDSHNSRKSASYEGQKDKPSIATSDVNDNGRSHIGGREHERKVGFGLATVSDLLSFEKVPAYKLTLMRNSMSAVVHMFKDPDQWLDLDVTIEVLDSGGKMAKINVSLLRNSLLRFRDSVTALRSAENVTIAPEILEYGRQLAFSKEKVSLIASAISEYNQEQLTLQEQLKASTNNRMIIQNHIALLKEQILQLELKDHAEESNMKKIQEKMRVNIQSAKSEKSELIKNEEIIASLDRKLADIPDHAKIILEARSKHIAAQVQLKEDLQKYLAALGMANEL